MHIAIFENIVNIILLPCYNKINKTHLCPFMTSVQACLMVVIKVVVYIRCRCEQ